MPMSSASEFSGLKPNTLKRLAWADRIVAIKPGGRDSLISYMSLDDYLNKERKPIGRPRKNTNEHSD